MTKTLTAKRYSSMEITLRDAETDERTNYIVFGINYEPALLATEIDPPEPSRVDWYSVELRENPGRRIGDELIYEELYDAILSECES